MTKEKIAQIVKFDSNKIYLQIGAFQEKDNALKMQPFYQEHYDFQKLSQV